MQVRIQTPKMSVIHPLHAKNFHFFPLVYIKTTKHSPPVCYGVGRMREFSSKSPDQISFYTVVISTIVGFSVRITTSLQLLGKKHGPIRQLSG